MMNKNNNQNFYNQPQNDISGSSKPKSSISSVTSSYYARDNHSHHSLPHRANTTNQHHHGQSASALSTISQLAHTTVKMCNLKNENLLNLNKNPFLSTNWQPNSVSINGLNIAHKNHSLPSSIITKFNDKFTRSVPLPSQFSVTIENTKMNSNNESSNKHRYFTPNKSQSIVLLNSNSDNRQENVHPILKNGFMRPQVVNINSSNPNSNINSNGIYRENSQANQKYTKSELNPFYFMARHQSANSISSSTSSMNSSSSIVYQNYVKVPVPVTNASTSNPNRLVAANKLSVNLTSQMEMDSKKAREAFFERIRHETSGKLKQEQQNKPANQSSTSLNSTLSTSSTPTFANHDEKKATSIQNMAKPFDAKTNFSNVVKIDTKFKNSTNSTSTKQQLNDSSMSTEAFTNKLNNSVSSASDSEKTSTNKLNKAQQINSATTPTITNNEENNLKNLKSLWNRRLSFNNEMIARKFKHFEKLDTGEIVKPNFVNSSLTSIRDPEESSLSKGNKEEETNKSEEKKILPVKNVDQNNQTQTQVSDKIDNLIKPAVKTNEFNSNKTIQSENSLPDVHNSTESSSKTSLSTSLNTDSTLSLQSTSINSQIKSSHNDKITASIVQESILKAKQLSAYSRSVNNFIMPINETNEDEENDKAAGFSDDELEENQNMKARMESGGATISRLNSSKVSLVESIHASDHSNSSTTSSASDEDEFADDDEDDEDSMNDYDNGSMSEILANFGYDYKSLFTVTTKKLDNGSIVKLKPPLIASLFFYVPPTINFVTNEEKLSEMPESLKKLCKWKMCSITPNIVKATINRSNFRTATHKSDWIGVWGSHMKPESFRSIREFQKMNHFPGSFQIGRKDRLCRNLYHAQALYGKNEYNFVPMTFVIPADYALLKTEVETRNSKWILKPPASARGQGIRVVSKLDQIPKKRPCVVQRYLSNPYLIDGLKFDLRIYVYVTSYDPLRIYLFNDGLTRFASRKYSNSVKTISDKFMHLTNFSINKSNKEYKSNDDENACFGHKWTIKALWTYLQKKGVNTDKIWENITDLVIKTIICSDSHVNVLVKTHLKRKYSVHELFGFDVILDENLKPWIVEVNISPSLHSSSPLDISVKGQMIADLFNLAGFMLPNPKEIAKLEGKKYHKSYPKILFHNKNVLPQQLANDEKAKHQFYIQKSSDEKTLPTIVDVLTPDDLRILIETEDEFSRRGDFIRIFPTANTKKYLKFFETTRYYNLLLHEWIYKFRNNRDKGIAMINNYCKKKVHLQNPTDIVENQWSQLKVSTKSSISNDHIAIKTKNSIINFKNDAKEEIVTN